MTTDPITLAREALDLTQEDETVTVCSVPDNKVAALARAVIRLADLADELDQEASEHMDRPVHSRSGTRIRAALNGDQK